MIHVKPEVIMDKNQLVNSDGLTAICITITTEVLANEG